MKVTFNIHYDTHFGEQLVLLNDLPAQLGFQAKPGLLMEFVENGIWSLSLEIPAHIISMNYRYAVVNNYGQIIGEELDQWKSLRFKDLQLHSLEVHDQWNSKDHPENALYNSAFIHRIFSPEKYEIGKGNIGREEATLTFSISMPRVQKHQQLCLLPEGSSFGNDFFQDKFFLGNTDFPNWELTIPRPDQRVISYRYGIYNHQSGKLDHVESGPARRHKIIQDFGQTSVVIQDRFFRHPKGNWKGTGIAIPVFSLKTKNSFGVGTFTDLKPMVDWCKQIGMKLLQILPINDTSATNTWVDSYPYAAISVFALHPLYLDVTAIPGFEVAVDQDDYQEQQRYLNSLAKVDYEKTLAAKMNFARAIYEVVAPSFYSNPKFQSFIAKNGHWLKPYALFCVLRDHFETVDFNEWGPFKTFTKDLLEELTSPLSSDYSEIAFYYFLQYYLDLQLRESTEYARANQVVLKGDIPIGIYRYSVDAWTQPHLFHMDGQSGAPPDPFSDLGQNWGFPTYNWSEMAKDGYGWWQNRLKTLSKYFDAFRIDHILGFFRIWQVPYHQTQAILGFFNPAIPVTLEEFKNRGIHFDYDRFCLPFLNNAILKDLFKSDLEEVIHRFFDLDEEGQLRFKPDFDTQRKVVAYFDQAIEANYPSWLPKLLKLHANVLFIEDPTQDEQVFHPRIEFQKTTSFEYLRPAEKDKLFALYFDYFYDRQNEFWAEQAMTKLPALKAATNMLICGEDLGMIPDSVPGVMRDLGLLTLEIQRMSKNPGTEFLHYDDVPYLSVCSPSTHDMSPVRAWWEEMSIDQRVRYYYQELGLNREPPEECDPYIANLILIKHLEYPSMWAIFPLQDLLGISPSLKHPAPLEERINVPAIEKHYWRYRMHLNIEDLIEATGFNEYLVRLLKTTGRY